MIPESKSNLLMWSHYTDEHRGVVLGFDTENSFFSDLKRVKYDSVIPDHLMASVDINDINSLLPLFFIKSDEWIYEKEHRVVRELTDSDYRLNEKTKQIEKNNNFASANEKHFFVVPYEALSSIYFGCRMEDDEKHKICKLLAAKDRKRGSNFTAFEALQTTQSFRLEFREFNAVE